MLRKLKIWPATFVVGLLWATTSDAQDLRNQFGTDSTEAAKHLDRAIELVIGKKAAEALPLLDKALAADADLQLTYYWKALALTDLGDIDAALLQYEKILAIAAKTRANNVTIDACINAGLTLAKLKQTRESNLWFTRAVTHDPDDQFRLRWKAFRNMAISRFENGDHLSAAVCALSAYAANPQKVELRMVSDFLDAVGVEEEVARALDFGQPLPSIEARLEPTQLEAVEDPASLDAVVSQLIVDAIGGRVIAVSRGSAKYYIIDTQNENTITAIPVAGPVTAAALVHDRLYLGVQGVGVVETKIGESATARTWKLTASPTSLAVFPTQGAAVFPVDRLLHVLDLESGKLTATEYYSNDVAADPKQQFCYSFIRREAGRAAGHVIVNGRPVIIHQSAPDFLQTALVKFALVNKRILPAEMRMNAASNGKQLYVSPEGDWVAVVGGGGWRPEQAHGNKTGYGVAVMAAADLSRVQGFFATEAYPQGLAVNPVTHQVAAVRNQSAKIYHISRTDDAVTLAGPHSGAAAWSPDGRYLYLAGSKGIRIWRNKLSIDEQNSGLAWSSVIPAVRDRTSVVVPRENKPLVEYGKFQIQNDRAVVEAAIRSALVEGLHAKPSEWLQYEPYQSDSELRTVFRDVSSQTDPNEAGIRIYRLKKLTPSQPHPGIEFLLGMSYFASGQLDQSKQHHLQAIRLDQARTNITLEALRCLGQIHFRQEQHAAAAFCYAHVLRLDLDNPGWPREAEPMFRRANFSDAARELLAAAGTAGRRRSMSAVSDHIRLPSLPAADGTTVYSAEQLFQACAGSVVLIRCGESSGSGVCVGDGGLVVTNRHVIESDRNSVKVYTFQMAEGKLTRAADVNAGVLFESETDDLALLQVRDSPQPLKPLPLTASPPASGGKVYAIGHPGFGNTLLDQTITEGIVSAPNREFSGRTFVQHTAAVNPGNSGGALLDDHGRVVGVVTWKTGLENVSFAIPADRVRAMFESLRQAQEKTE